MMALKKKILRSGLAVSVIWLALYLTSLQLPLQNSVAVSSSLTDPIQWVDFTIPYEAMKKAMDLDIDSHDSEQPLDWIEILSVLATRYGGNWNQYKSGDMDKVVQQLTEDGSAPEQEHSKVYYDYYYQAYTAVLGEFLGEHQREIPDKLNPGEKTVTEKYGLKAYSPIADGFGYNHYDDFGNSRNYVYTRNHLGHDLIGAIGTPICAVEAGIVEHLGWNQYGGWRVGIRSLDGTRYYYYAHLRKDRPYHINLEEGHLVKAGEVIGYLGMTGYSTQPNVSNMTVPHLHFGMQLIFDPSQEEGGKEIWIDVYEIVKLLNHNRATVDRDEESKEYYRRYDIFDPKVEAYIQANPLCRK